MANKNKRRCDTLPVLHPDAAGIDVGASELYVAVSADRDLRRGLGISDSLIGLSVGLEASEDILADLAEAFAVMG